VVAVVPPRAEITVGTDDQQLYGGTQSALSRTLLLWTSSAGAGGAPIVEKQRSHPGLLFLVQSRHLAVT
jgi:hypothetical protein